MGTKDSIFAIPKSKMTKHY